jgi:DNA-binding MarR family transcriptional regulator
MMVAHEGSQTISELSRKIGVDPSTLVPSVDAMERKELIIRQRDLNDRRRIPLSLTESGKSLLGHIKVMGDEDPIMAGCQEMDDGDLHQLLSLLCKLIENLPESEKILEHATSRLYAYGAKEEHLICKQQEK